MLIKKTFNKYMFRVSAGSCRVLFDHLHTIQKEEYEKKKKDEPSFFEEWKSHDKYELKRL